MGEKGTGEKGTDAFSCERTCRLVRKNMCLPPFRQQQGARDRATIAIAEPHNAKSEEAHYPIRGSAVLCGHGRKYFRNRRKEQRAKGALHRLISQRLTPGYHVA